MLGEDVQQNPPEPQRQSLKEKEQSRAERQGLRSVEKRKVEDLVLTTDKSVLTNRERKIYEMGTLGIFSGDYF